MRSLMTGMLISMITMFFATWFLSNSILKTIQKDKSVSSEKNESLTEKIKYGQDNKSSSVASYTRSPSRDGITRFQKPVAHPFGAKLNLRDNSNPFAPKLSLRRPHSWSFKRKTEPPRQEKQYQQSDSSPKTSSNKSSSPIISGYQNYIDILNEQMKD